MLHEGDLVGGVSFRYDPQGGDPWLIYSHGTIDTSAAILIDFTLEQGRLHGGTWTFTPVSYPDSPISVDLDFAADGTPQVCFLAARDYSLSFPVSFTASLLYDVVVAVKSGNVWSMSPIFTGTLTPHYTFPNPYITIDVDDGAGVRWTTTSELLYTKLTGSVQLDIATQQPTGGTLTPSAQYMVRQGSSYVDDSRFTASPGHSFSWSLADDGHLAAAYIKSDPVDPQELFSGHSEPENDLIYWRWFPPPPS